MDHSKDHPYMTHNPYLWENCMQCGRPNNGPNTWDCLQNPFIMMFSMFFFKYNWGLPNIHIYIYIYIFIIIIIVIIMIIIVIINSI